LRQKATAARSPALKPVPAPADSGPATIASLGRQLREVLPARRLQSVSLCDAEGNVLWLSEGALGPDENSLIVEALVHLAEDPSLPCYEMGVEDGRLALFLPVRAPAGALLGAAMILADSKSVGDDTLERMAAAPVRALVQRIAVLLKPADARGNGASGEPPPAGAENGVATSGESISPEEMNDLLQFEKPAPQAPASPVASVEDTGMISLEFVPHPRRLENADAPASASAAAPAAMEPAAPEPAEMPLPREAPAAAAVEAHLQLEVLPFATLRTNGQTRRFQVLVHLSPAPRNPAALDALVLERLIEWLSAHRSTWNSQPTGFTVSLSLATLEDERFVPKLAAALNARGIAGETLGFEIAEALCTQSRALVERFLGQCEKLGAWVMIDGFSFDSQVLPLLRSKALRLVRIDPKLTSSALKDRLSQALVVATIQAARVLGINCAARRVDSQAALQWLTAIGCDFAQGAVLAPALSLDALASAPDVTALTLPQKSTQKS